jgi:bifunctional DNase/RNase
MTPSRPLTHDLFKNFADTFNVKIKEVIIYNLVDGIFFAKLISENDDKEVEIDARTSDAIALAVRFDCPIYTYEFILTTAGVFMEEQPKEGGIPSIEEPVEKKVSAKDDKDLTKKSTEELKEMLNGAISGEDYERASRIRDELNKRKKS